MGRDVSVLGRRNDIELGKFDFSEHVAVTNAAAPGTLIRTHTSGMEVNVTGIIIYNPAGAAAVITFYDEDSNIKLIISLATLETADLDLKASIVYGQHDIYARSDQAAGANITVAGKESWV